MSQYQHQYLKEEIHMVDTAVNNKRKQLVKVLLHALVICMICTPKSGYNPESEHDHIKQIMRLHDIQLKYTVQRRTHPHSRICSWLDDHPKRVWHLLHLRILRSTLRGIHSRAKQVSYAPLPWQLLNLEQTHKCERMQHCA